jgi:hypothetical protein
MIKKPIVAILHAGPETSGGPKSPETSTSFVIDVQTTNGPAIFSIWTSGGSRTSRGIG